MVCIMDMEAITLGMDIIMDTEVIIRAVAINLDMAVCLIIKANFLIGEPKLTGSSEKLPVSTGLNYLKSQQIF